jgi:hypothetical protein
MTDLKNTASAIALAAVLMVGTASANTKITNQNATQLTKCTVNYTNVIKGIGCAENRMRLPKIRV